jgi:hypothetical protein
MGSLSGFLYNVSPTAGRSWSSLRETADAVEMVGHSKCAKILRDLARRLERMDQATEWGKFLAPLEKHLESKIEPRIERYIDEIYPKLEAFTEKHFG